MAFNLENTHHRLLERFACVKEWNERAAKLAPRGARPKASEGEEASPKWQGRLNAKSISKLLNSGEREARGLDELELVEVKRKYCEIAASLLPHYLAYADNNQLAEARSVINEYQVRVTAHNIVGRLDSLAGELERALRLSGREGESMAARFHEEYYGYHISFPVKRSSNNTCSVCGGTMHTREITSELMCGGCGNITMLVGTIFDDTQFYNQQGQSSKYKKYAFIRHGSKWLRQIQAKENKVIPPAHIKAIADKAVQEYTRGGLLRSMTCMTCREIRQWLKELKLTRYNNHAPLIRKIVTSMYGAAIAPPQLTREEEEIMLADFSQIMVLHEEISNDRDLLLLFGKECIKNKFYYPFVIMKILQHHLAHDARLRELISCIHFQKDTTLAKNDATWERICQRMPGYVYQPTDSTLLAVL